MCVLSAHTSETCRAREMVRKWFLNYSLYDLRITDAHWGVSNMGRSRYAYCFSFSLSLYICLKNNSYSYCTTKEYSKYSKRKWSAIQHVMHINPQWSPFKPPTNSHNSSNYWIRLCIYSSLLAKHRHWFLWSRRPNEMLKKFLPIPLATDKRIWIYVLV